MLYYDFKNYEEFKDIFGIVEHGNGVKSRRNKILLALYKDKEQLRTHIMRKALIDARNGYYNIKRRIDSMNERTLVQKNKRKAIYTRRSYSCAYNNIDETVETSGLLWCTNLTQLKQRLYEILGDSRFFIRGTYHGCIKLMGMYFHSDSFETDDMEGLCEDGTLNAIRYRNIEKGRVFKMKAGRMFNNILSCNRVTKNLPEQIQRWLSEEFVAEWIEYARENIGTTEYNLHVDDNFEKIYSSCYYAENNFGSCMVNDDQWPFYRDAVKAKAAYLTNSDDKVVARCILFTDVHEEDSDKIWRLAERQYSRGEDLSLQRQLVSALVRGGYIDGYKKVGASCHDARAFVDNEGNSLEDRCFWIKCNLEGGDTLSYQDSFKWYDEDNHVADNFGDGEEDLATTDGTYGSSEDDHDGESWSEYHDCYINDYDSCWIETRQDYFYSDECVDARRWNSYRGCFVDECCFEDDCVEINGTYYYAGDDADYPEDNLIYECPKCGEYIVFDDGYGSDIYYSELTGEDYCCESCRESAENDWHRDNGHVFSEWDDKWYENADDVITVKEYVHGWWRNPYFKKTIISVESFNELVERGEATEYLGKYYIDELYYDGEPVHLELAKSIAA